MDIIEHSLPQFLISVITIMAGFILVKTLVTMVPDSNTSVAAFKKVILSA